ncbi:DNA-directed rna polymerase III subunit [Alternaria alternata]|nr:DNA-directed rna polymerase III subunit [Alternaria alternata]
MASVAAPSPAPKEEPVETAVNEVVSPADALYEKCAQRPAGQIFFQRDLSNMQVAETMAQLTVLLQELCDRHLLKLMTFEGDPCWKLRSREDADKKMYLLKHLKPSEDIAGGPWQSEGDFDTALIDTISGIVAQHVENETCIRVPGNWNDYEITGDRTAAIAQKKAEVLGAVRDIEEAPAVKPYNPSRDPNTSKLVHRHNPQYPTAASVAQWLNSKEILRGKTVREDDMEQMLEMMVLDDRLEKISGTNYRTVLRATDTKVYNGFVDAPCGNCPVFDLCGDEGEISARTCVYFGQWLETTSEEI